MFAPQPRCKDVVYRELVPGFIGFDCKPLLASLSPAACALKWQSPVDGSVCRGCSIGAAHAGQPDALPKPAMRTCCRCGQSSVKIIGGTHCVSCYNRSREADRGLNCKSSYPWRTGDSLRRCWAIVSVENSNRSLRKIRVSKQTLNDGIQRPGVRPILAPGAPMLSWLDSGNVWIEAIVTGPDELDRIVDCLLPGGRIIESDFSASFSSQWEAQGFTRSHQEFHVRERLPKS